MRLEHTCLQAAHIDVHEVRIAAISAVVDLLMRHGLASFITTSNSAGEDLDNSGTGSEAAASRCADITDSLDLQGCDRRHYTLFYINVLKIDIICIIFHF